MELSTSCSEDYIELQSWSESSERWAPVGEPLCGRTLPHPLTSPTGHSRLVFRSNRVELIINLAGSTTFSPQAVSGDGFTLRWKVGCGGEFDSPSGHLVSPNYPTRVSSCINIYLTVRFSVWQLPQLHMDHISFGHPLRCGNLFWDL